MNNHQIQKIERVRAKVIENQQINDELYEGLINDLDIEKYSSAEEYLFDAIFNTPDQNAFVNFLQEYQKQISLEE